MPFNYSKTKRAMMVSVKSG